MKLLVRNTSSGLKPEYDSDYEHKKRLKNGSVYWVEIKEARNYENHKRFFAMVNCVWHNLPEFHAKKFPNVDTFRYDLMIKAGYFQLIYQTESKVVVKPESISFSNMDETKFREVFSDVLDVILSQYVDVDKANFLNAMLEFM
jgi:hypothetical protein